MKRVLSIIGLLAASLPAFGQAAYSGNVTTVAKNVPPGGQAPIYSVPFAQIYVCSVVATSGLNCSTAVPIFSDIGLTIPVVQPLVSDGQGRFTFFAANGTYYLVILDQYGNLISAQPVPVSSSTGGGTIIASSDTINTANNQIQADSITQSASNGLTLFGDSITQGFGSIGTGSSYASIIASDYGIPSGSVNNQGVPGDRVQDEAFHIFTVANPTDTGNPIFTSMIGTNNATLTPGYPAVHFAAHSWLALSSSSKVLAGSVYVTKTGTTAVDTTFANANGLTCTTGPCTVTYQASIGTPDAFYLWYKEVSSGANISVTVDSVPVTDTITGNAVISTTWPTAPAVQTATVGGARFYNAAFNTGTASSHTIVVTMQSGATIIGLGFPPTNRYRGISSPRVILGGVPPQMNAANAGLVAVVNGYNLATSKLLVADGLNAPFADVSILDPVSDFAGVGFLATISGTTMTVSSLTTSGSIMPNGTFATVGPTPITAGTHVLAQVSGTAGGAGTYTIDQSQTVSTAEQMYIGTQGYPGSNAPGFHPNNGGHRHLAQIFESVINSLPNASLPANLYYISATQQNCGGTCVLTGNPSYQRINLTANSTLTTTGLTGIPGYNWTLNVCENSTGGWTLTPSSLFQTWPTMQLATLAAGPGGGCTTFTVTTDPSGNSLYTSGVFPPGNGNGTVTTSGTPTVNAVTKFTSATAIGNSSITDNGSSVTIGNGANNTGLDLFNNGTLPAPPAANYAGFTLNLSITSPYRIGLPAASFTGLGFFTTTAVGSGGTAQTVDQLSQATSSQVQGVIGTGVYDPAGAAAGVASASVTGIRSSTGAGTTDTAATSSQIVAAANAATVSTTPFNAFLVHSQVFDVTDYGAKCDGTTNDITAILAAQVAAVNSFGTYGTPVIRFPSGKVCIIGAPITMSETTPIWWTSTGTHSAMIQPNAAISAIFSKGDGAFAERGGISNLILNGNVTAGNVTTAAATNAINVGVYRDFEIGNNKMFNTAGTLIVLGDGNSSLVGPYVHDNQLRYDSTIFTTAGTQPNYSVVLNVNASDGSLVNNIATNALVSSFYINAPNTTMSGNNHPFGYPLNTYTPQNCFEIGANAIGFTGIGNYCDGSTNAAFLLDGGSNVTLIGNRQFFVSGTTTTTAPIVKFAATVSLVNIIGNTAENSTATNQIVYPTNVLTNCPSCNILGNTPGNGGVLNIDSDGTNGLTARFMTSNTSTTPQIAFGTNYTDRFKIGVNGAGSTFNLTSLQHTTQIFVQATDNGGLALNGYNSNSVAVNNFSGSGGLFKGYSINGTYQIFGNDTSGNWSIYTPNVATSTPTNFNGPYYATCGVFWSGTASTADCFKISNVAQTGSNPNFLATFAGSGSTGAHDVSFPEIYAAETASGTSTRWPVTAGVDLLAADSTYHNFAVSLNGVTRFAAFPSGVNAQTGTTYTIATTDDKKLVTFTNAAATAVTLPVATTAGFGPGSEFNLVNEGAGLVTVTPTSSTVNLAASFTLANQQFAKIFSDGLNYEAFIYNTQPKLLTATNCAAVGTAASPSLVACGSAGAGSFSCATNASAATCTVADINVTANSEVLVQLNSAVGTRLGVTCNTAPTGVPAITLQSITAGTSFTINVPTISTNPACYSFTITN